MPRPETQLDRIERGVTDLTLIVKGDEAGGKVGLAETVRRLDAQVNPPWWRHGIREVKGIVIAAAASVGIHTGLK